MSQHGSSSRDAFVQQSTAARTGIVRELAEVLAHNKKWWLTPIILALLLVGALIVLSGTAAAPFIYTLF